MVISLKELARAPQQTICFDYTMDLSKEELNFEFPFKEPVKIIGEIEERLDAVSLTADIEATVTTQCARCNKTVHYEKIVPVSFILSKDLDRSEMDDIIILDSDSVDLDEIMRSELILDMESSVLCKEDCRGLCPKCGSDLNEGECGCNRREVDPRLAKLQALLGNTEIK
jgi:uncharacterized protein